MKEQLIKLILELIKDDDIICSELHKNEEEKDFCSRHCEGINEMCVRRLIYQRILNE